MMKDSKKCSKCQVEKSLDEFAVNSRNKTDGKCSKCKSCQKEYRDNNKHRIAEVSRKWREKNAELVKQKKSEYYFENKDEINAKHKKYRQENIETIKITRKLDYQKNKERYKDKAKKWREQNPDYRKTKKYKDQRKKTRKKRYSEDVLYKLSEKIRSSSFRIANAIKQNKNFKSIKYLGCTLEELKTHIESQWQEGMTWENHGLYGWHIDHIVPVDWFIKNSDDPWEANHYTNLQPLWAIDNLKKGNDLS